MTSRTIALDIDNSIWDCYPLYNEAAKNIFGRGYDEDDCDDWFWLSQEFGKDYWKIFDEALSQKNLKNRRLYEGVVENVDKLRYLRFDIHFVTHNRKSESISNLSKSGCRNLLGISP